MAKKENILMQEIIAVGKMTRIFPDGSKEIFEDITLDGESEKVFLHRQGMMNRDVNVCESPDIKADMKAAVLVEPVETPQPNLPAPVLQDRSLPVALLLERPLFSQIVELFLRERKSDGRTKGDYEYLQNLFIKIYTDQPINTYDIRIAYDFRKILTLLPANFSRQLPWREMSIKEILNDERLEQAKKLDMKRIDQLLTRKMLRCPIRILIDGMRLANRKLLLAAGSLPQQRGSLSGRKEQGA